ncbi:MAG: hypothetical protein ACUVRM_07180 [Bacillota bacterium]
MKLSGPVRTAFILFSLSSIGVAAGFFLFFRARDRQEAEVSSWSTPKTESPGGEGLQLEIFSLRGQRLWRLRFKTASLLNADTLEAKEIRATYYAVTPPIAFTAEQLRYEPDRASLFLYRVVMTGPNLRIDGTELSWEEKTRSFSIKGGYSLRKDGVIMQGEHLHIQEDLSSLRAIGAVRLHLPVGKSETK